jgi:hypothetical protein
MTPKLATRHSVQRPSTICSSPPAVRAPVRIPEPFLRTCSECLLVIEKVSVMTVSIYPPLLMQKPEVSFAPFRWIPQPFLVTLSLRVYAKKPRDVPASIPPDVMKPKNRFVFRSSTRVRTRATLGIPVFSSITSLMWKSRSLVNLRKSFTARDARQNADIDEVKEKLPIADSCARAREQNPPVQDREKTHHRATPGSRDSASHGCIAQRYDSHQCCHPRDRWNATVQSRDSPTAHEPRSINSGSNTRG